MSAAVEAAQKQLDNISVEQLEAALSSVNLAQPHQDMAPHSRPQSKKTSSVYDSGSSSARQERKPMYLCEPFCKRALVQGKLKNICVCPPGVERDEWIAVNLIDFWAQLNNVFSVVFAVCECQSMSVGPNFDLFWRDQRERPAFTYCDSTLSWVQTLTTNKTVFPTEQGREFPPEFATIAQRIYIQLLMLFAHIYYKHFPDMVHLEAEGHLNSFAAHYLTFGLLNGLIQPTSKELTTTSRKGYVMGHLLRKFQEVGTIPKEFKVSSL